MKKIAIINPRLLFLLLLTLLGLSCTRTDSKRIYQGYVEAENIYLASPNSGILKKKYVTRGNAVTKGQLLAELDPEPQALIVEQIKGDLLQARKTLNDLEKPRRAPEIAAIKAQIEQIDAQLKLAQIRVKRMTALLKQNAIDKDSVDAAVANYKQQKELKAQYESNLQLARLGSRNEQIKAQQAQVISVIARLKEAQWQLAQKRVIAPEDGYIFDTYYSVGEFVPNQQAVLSILSPKNIRIEFFVPARELAFLQRGQIIFFQCYGCAEKTSAKISYISPEAQYIPPLVYSRENNEKLVFRIKALIKEPHQYKPGQPVLVFLP